jgi:hypothetical protein
VNELGEWIELGELCICILKKKKYCMCRIVCSRWSLFVVYLIVFLLGHVYIVRVVVFRTNASRKY